MAENKYISLIELAKILRISRIAVYKKVKKGQIKAIKIGRNYAVLKKYVDEIIGKNLSNESKNRIDTAVKKTIKEYSQTLKLLAKE